MSKSHYQGDDLELTRRVIAASAGLRATQPDLKGPSIIEYSGVGAPEQYEYGLSFIKPTEATLNNTQSKSHMHLIAPVKDSLDYKA